MKMILKDGKCKVLTLSYDDGVVQDIRLMDILNKNGIKGTFNINSGLYVDEDAKREKFFGRLKLSEALSLYKDSGNEISVHSVTHPHLEKCTNEEIVYEIKEDRKKLEIQYGKIVRGMAYPYGTYNESVLEIIEKCGILYSRTVKSTRQFTFPENWLLLHPTCHHNDPSLMELAKKFVEDKNSDAKMFYLWGHSYEFDNNDNWNIIEEFCSYIGCRDDIWYATNMEVFDYVRAYESLSVSIDESMVYNPSSIDVWFENKENIYCVRSGETIKI